MTYPILVERWDAQHPSDMAVCERCHATFKWDPSEGDPSDLCSTHGNATVGECGGNLIMMYDEAPRCGGCGKFGYWDEALNYCCSRVCMFQADYAKTLADS